ncbi:MAG: S-layer homology domain-containing protein, partial [Candidatus Peregrinibacteria bacterium]|nr:S-layer homology domain-containing protein [Candidatus Peregrinibacteria bacterium]
MSNLLKRITGFFLLLALSTATSVEARAFPDVPSSHKHFQAIDYLSNNDVIHGYPDGWFRPEGLINRAEA